MSNVKASILIFSAQKVPKVRSDLLYTYDSQCYWVFCCKMNTHQTFHLIGKNNNTRTVQAESSKFASVLFDQGFQIWVGWN